MADRKNRIKMTSARGRFKFPKLNEPDYGSKDYPNPDGSYKTKIVYDAEDPSFKEMIAKLKPYHEAAIENARAAFKELKVETRKKLGDITINDLFTTLYDKETEEPTGEVEMTFSMKASGVVKKGPRAGKKWTRKPTIFDAKGKPMLKTPDIWGGTVGKVSFSFDPDGYFVSGTGACGISFSLEAVQIIDLVSGGTRQASDFGFEEEEGYEYEEPTESAEFKDEFGPEGGEAADPAGASEF